MFAGLILGGGAMIILAQGAFFNVAGIAKVGDELGERLLVLENLDIKEVATVAVRFDAIVEVYDILGRADIGLSVKGFHDVFPFVG